MREETFSIGMSVQRYDVQSIRVGRQLIGIFFYYLNYRRINIVSIRNKKLI